MAMTRHLLLIVAATALLAGCQYSGPSANEFDALDRGMQRDDLPSYGYVVERYNKNIEHATRLWSKASMEFYFVDPDGFEVEFIQYLSDLPVDRNRSA